MMRQINLLRYVCGAGAIALVLAAQAAVAQGLRYQDANELPEFGTVNVRATDPEKEPAFKSNLPVVDNDNLWNYRDFGAATTIYQSGVTEDSPMLTQTVSGLTPGTSYDLYAVYWTDEDENWTIRTGTSAGSLNFYSWTGAGGAQPVAGSTQGLAAATAVWAVNPPPTKESTIFTERPADPLVMILGYAGTATANPSGQIDVFIDDNPNAGGPRRTWFDGVAYVNAGTPIAATATLDRTTGALTLNNPTSQSFQIKSYRIESPTTGALNAATWNRISASNGAWTTTAPADPANTPFTNLLSEDGGGTSVTLAGGGGSLSFGNVWNKSPFDHVLVYLTLGDDSLAVLAAHYSGPAIVNGDLDGNGALNLADYQTLLNNLQSSPGLTRVENYRRGEMTGDGVINFNDWVAFRTAYNAALGAGAFEALLAQVPEPSGLALMAVAGVAASFCRRRRITIAACPFMLCIALAGTSSAVTLLKVDVDSRAGDSTAGPPGPNTVDGFQSFTLNTGTTGAQPTAMGTVGGYNISLTAVTSAGTPLTTGGMDDRDRATPTTAPTLNQLYDDFIFTGAAVGVGGGIDMMISGGSLAPNTQYSVSIYAFDTGSTGAVRTANWLDGNSANAVALSTAFAGATSPTTDEQYRFNGVFRTDGAGSLFLRGRSTMADTSPGLFLNGFEISTDLPPPPVELTLRVNTDTGAVSIVNQQSVSFDMSYYEIRSAAGSLNLGGWTSLDDAEGVDPVGTGWDEVPASSANLLSEVNLLSMTSFAPGNSVSLGNAFSVGGTQDLQLLYAGPNETALRVGNVSYVTGPGGIAGDYNGNGRVDAADYVIWRKTLNTNTTLPNDTTPGTVTQADYGVWRANFGKTGGAGASLAASTAVPEPSVGVVIVAALGIVSAARVGRCRSALGAVR